MFGKNQVVGQKFFSSAANDTLFVTSMFWTLQGEGPYRGKPAFFIRLAKCNLDCHFCFVGSTDILMGDGTNKKIKDVTIGDVVMSWDNDKFVPKKVIRTYKNIADSIVKVYAGNKKVWVTPDHPFLTSNRGWVKAKDLNTNDVLVNWTMSDYATMFNSAHRGRKRVLMTDKQKQDAAIRLFGDRTSEKTVYNLEVEDTHTYIANGLVVNNCDTFFDDGDWLTFDQIFNKIDQELLKFYGGKLPNWIQEQEEFTPSTYNAVLVITGGEPMLQKNLGPFLERAKNVFLETQIESNGTLLQDIPYETTLVVSPKCSEKTQKYLKPNQKVLDRASCLKFVMSGDKDSPYYTVPDWALEWKSKHRGEIYVSPMNIYNDLPQKSKHLRATTNQIDIETRSNTDEIISFWEPGLLDMKQNQINHEHTAKYALQYGCVFNMQLHLFASMA
jgi:organic radical activating enzyme